MSNRKFVGEVGPPRAIYIGQAKRRRFINPNGKTFGWGKMLAEGAATAEAILASTLKDQDRARRLKTRFLHRVVALWNENAGWSITEDEVLAAVAEIEKVFVETAPMRRMMALEPAPVMTDRGRDIVWTKEPKLKRNEPKVEK